MKLFIIFIFIFTAVYASFQIDNEIIGEPAVDCEDVLLGLTFKTKKPFTGRVYVQGLSDDQNCSRSFVNNRNASRMSIEINNGDCAMNRHRVSGKVEGLMFSLTLIVSFHGTFVTRADKAFKCMCFYKNQKTLTNSIQMEAIQSDELINTVPSPTCTYTIRSESAEGPPIVFSSLGAKIFHVWQCDEPSKGFLVHSCKVKDGRGYEHVLMDVDGCAVDPVIQPDLVYDEEKNIAVAETYGYKFSDTNALNYECIVEICDKDRGECSGLTPPVCERTEVIRERRQVKDIHHSIDVAASINMIDTLKAKILSEEELKEIEEMENLAFNRMNEEHSLDFTNPMDSLVADSIQKLEKSMDHQDKLDTPDMLEQDSLPSQDETLYFTQLWTSFWRPSTCVSIGSIIIFGFLLISSFILSILLSFYFASQIHTYIFSNNYLPKDEISSFEVKENNNNINNLTLTIE